MASIVVITFENETEAVKARQALRRVQDQENLGLQDAVTIVKQQDGKIKVKDETGKDVVLGAISGSFLGLVIGGFFFPIAGLVLGAIGGGFLGKQMGMGIDKKFIKEVEEQLQPGNSAIFLVVQEIHLNYVIAVFKPFEGKIYYTSLPEDAELSLREALSHRIGEMDNQMIALGFEGQATAENMLEQVGSWQKQGIITLDDAVVASRGQEAKVDLHQTKTLTRKYAVGGGGIGLLAGLLLGGPIGGLVAGAALGATAGKRKDIGIDDHVIKEVSDELRPDTSMLFLLGKSVKPEQLRQKLSELDASVVATSLSDEQQGKIKELLELNDPKDTSGSSN